MDIKVHRKGRIYIEQGRSLVWKAGESFRLSRELRNRLEYLKHTNPVEFREFAEKVTVELVKYLVAENHGEAVELSKVQQDGSFKIGVSPETIKRYVFTHTASDAELKMVGKRVTVNPFFKEDDDELSDSLNPVEKEEG